MNIDLTTAFLDESPLRKQAEEKVQEFLALGAFRFNIPSSEITIIAVDWDLKGTFAGRAYWENLKPFRISLNWHLCLHNEANFLAQTIPHEVAHCIAVLAFGSSGTGHGSGWKHVMRVFGIPPDRCHSYDIQMAQAKASKFIYTCSCGTHHLSTSVHLAVQKGQDRVCRRCSHSLVWTKKETK